MFDEIRKPMLANRINENDLNTLNDYVLETKYDGSRVIMFLDFEKDIFRIKHRNSRTDLFIETPISQFPEFSLNMLKRVLRKNIKNIVLDGELTGKDFGEVISRFNLMGNFKIKLASEYSPLTFVAFDVLMFNDTNLIDLPYLTRRETLSKIITTKNPRITVSEVFDTGEKREIFNKLIDNGKEGIVAKRKDSRYFQKRTDEWLKCKRTETEELEILDFDIKSKSRPQKNKSIQTRVLNLITKIGRITVPRQEDIDYFYANKPKIVEVEFQELSKEKGKMRFPIFKRFRE